MRKLVILCLTVGLAGASNFYIFYKQVGANPNCPALSIDAYNNAPSHRKWAMDSAGNFSEDGTRGDWLIRAVLDWTPQDTNASVVWFGTNMPNDTVPYINFPVRVWVKNMGNAPLPKGTPVRLSISGPNSYSYDDTAPTAAALNHRAISMVNFTPAWHIPDVPGEYNIKVWTEAAGEMWPADDTIAYDLTCYKWIQYHTEAQLHWLTWADPERAVKINPADFRLDYPVGITRVRAEFYMYDTLPWDDSSFTFKVYGNNGQTLLYQSETLEAVPGMPGPYVSATLDSMVVIDSGAFYVAVAPVSSNGYPSSCGDSSVGGHSYWGGPSYWYLWDPDTSQSVGGELFISAVAQGNVGPAGGEQWIGPSEKPHRTVAQRPPPAQGNVCAARAERLVVANENQHHTILDPEPDALFLASPMRFFGVADTLRYDDGASARYWYQDSAGGGRGVKFISPADSVAIAGALIHFYLGEPVPGDTFASLRVYADDGIDGAPGTQLYAVDSFGIRPGSWNFIPLAPVSVEGGFEPGLSGPSLWITNYPNPVTRQLTLKWQVLTAMPVAVNLYDATGRMMRNLYTASGQARAGTLAMDARSLAAGIYLVRLETAKGSATRKLVIDR